MLVNDYREMMGLRRLFIDPRLCRAAKKHSAEQDKVRSIWHEGTDGTPGSRAAAEGYSATVGENVAQGYANPKDIWERGWCRSSGHHRNALIEHYTCIGYGYVGDTGTQMFGKIAMAGK